MRKLITSMLYSMAALLIAAGSFGVLFGAAPGHTAPLIGPDKYLHAGGSAVIGLAVRTQINDPVKAWALAMVPGVAKELLDARRGGSGFSVADLVADGLGAYVGVKLGGVLFTRNSIHYTRSF